MKQIAFICTAVLLVFSMQLSFSSQLTITSMEESAYTELNRRLMEQVYQQLGLSMKLLKYPAKRALTISNSGEVDGELFRIANLTRKWKNLYVVPTPIAHMEGVVYSREVDFKVNGWESLSPYTIGIKRGILHAERGTEGMVRQKVDSNTQLFKILKNGRVDIIVLAHLNAISEIQKHGFTNVKLLSPAVFSLPVYHYVHKKNKALIPEIDQQIRKMTASGELQAITNQYIQELQQTDLND